MKKLISILCLPVIMLCLCACKDSKKDNTASIPAIDLSAPETSSDSFEYYLNAEKIYITKYKGSDKNVVIPSKIEGAVVTVIASGAFCDTDIESVILSSSVTEIGEEAFKDCTKLHTVVLNEGLDNIGNEAFMGCTALAKIELPHSLKIIGNAAFYQCSSLKKIKIPSSVLGMGYETFRFAGLTEVEFEDGIEYIGGAYSFWCRNLKSVTIPASVTRIDSKTFGNHIESITFLGDAPELGYEAIDHRTAIYYDPTKLGWKYIELNETYVLTKIGEEPQKPERDTAADDYIYTFSDDKTSAYINGYTGIDKNIVIPESIEGAKVVVVYGFSSTEVPIEQVTIPDSVEYIGEQAFMNCEKLHTVKLGKGVKRICSRAFYGCSALENIELPSGITTLNDDAFYECTSLKKITIPNTVTDMGMNVFCFSGLSELNLQEGIKSIGSYACFWSENLKTVTIPASVEQIGEYSFVEPLESATFLGDAPKHLGDHAFDENTVIYYNPNTNGWDTTPLRDSNTLIAIEQ